MTFATGINSHNDSVICHLNSWANSVKSHTLFSPHHISYLSTSMLSISYKRTIDFITAFMLWGRGRGTASNIGWGVGKRSFMWRYLLILMQTISPSENIKISTQKLQKLANIQLAASGIDHCILKLQLFFTLLISNNSSVTRNKHQRIIKILSSLDATSIMKLNSYTRQPPLNSNADFPINSKKSTLTLCKIKYFYELFI